MSQGRFREKHIKIFLQDPSELHVLKIYNHWMHPGKKLTPQHGRFDVNNVLLNRIVGLGLPLVFISTGDINMLLTWAGVQVLFWILDAHIFPMVIHDYKTMFDDNVNHPDIDQKTEPVTADRGALKKQVENDQRRI